MPGRDKEGRRSMLQILILIHLQKGPVKTITDLAHAVKFQRPSVSRSMRLLRADGLIEQSDQGWCLTDAGLREAQEAETKLAAMTEKAAKSLTSSIQGLQSVADLQDARRQQQAALAHLDQANRQDVHRQQQAALEDAHRRQQAARAHLDQANRQDARRQQQAALEDAHRRQQAARAHLDQANRQDTRRQQQAALEDAHRRLLAAREASYLKVAEAIKPLAEAQRLNLRLLDKVTEPLHTYSDLAAARDNSLLLSGAMENTFALEQSALANLAKNTSTIDRLAWAWPRLSEVTRSFGRLFEEQSSTWLTQPSLPLERAQSESMVLPTATVTRYTESLRWLDEAESDTPTRPLHTPTDDLGDEGLDSLLARINPEFVKMRQGSWQTLRAGGLDRLRQAAVSQREMLSQLLCRLVPDTALPEGARSSPSIKTRAKIILGGSRSGADFVDAVAKALFEFYNQLNKYTHQNEKHEASLRAILQTGEGLIRLILVQAK